MTDEHEPIPSRPPPSPSPGSATRPGDAGDSQPPPPTGPPLSIPSGPPVARDAPPAAGWGPARVFGGLAFLLVIVIFEALLVSLFDPGIETLGGQVTLQALLAASLIGTAALFAGADLRSLAPREVLGLRPPLRPAVWLTIATYLGYVACAIALALLLSPEQEDITRELGADSGAAGTVIAGVLIVVLAPLSEEIFFRGFMFAGLRRAMPVPVAAVLASAIWGLFHYTGPGTWGVVIQITVFGLWLSWLYQRTGSLYTTIAVHMLNNAIAFAILVSSG